MREWAVLLDGGAGEVHVGPSGRGGGVAEALIWRIRGGDTGPCRRAARASCRQVKAPFVWALTSSWKGRLVDEHGGPWTVGVGGLLARRAW